MLLLSDALLRQFATAASTQSSQIHKSTLTGDELAANGLRRRRHYVHRTVDLTVDEAINAMTK